MSDSSAKTAESRQRELRGRHRHIEVRDLSVPSGWLTVVSNFVESVNDVLPVTSSPFPRVVVDAKEKYGSLRLNVQGTYDLSKDDALETLVDLHEDDAEATCMACGGPASEKASVGFTRRCDRAECAR
ncbi:hypothetical protein CKO28_13425 [Rhodovibrio sodomensis]|uniref:Uncharacterized protein n=1 Tax=Rhodovibrio sodomensis TaxID=1088 RepID=A0ABS1DHP1_9PROT|nr:hypothetical protein [Rhodovibrio sodomensis]MBK1669033.1 hypothetical protein [Rhodovibrio sodomensis]